MILFFLGCPHEEANNRQYEASILSNHNKIHILNEKPVSIVEADNLIKEIFLEGVFAF